MAIAIVGLIGVIAGALLGGLLSFSVEASKRRNAAYMAGSLIATELAAVIDIMLSAFPETGPPEWWEVHLLPTTFWSTHAAELLAYRIPGRIPGKPEPVDPRINNLKAFPMAATAESTSTAVATDAAEATHAAISRDLVTRLGAAYLSIEAWNAEKKSDPPISGDLLRDLEKYSAVRGDLKRYTRGLERRPIVSIRRTATVLATIAVIVIGVSQLLISRPDASSQTVAGTLQSHLGRSDLVHCDPSGAGEWSCIDQHLSGPLSVCQAVAAVQGIAVGDVALVRFIQPQDCTEAAAPTPYDVRADGTTLLATRETPGGRVKHQAAEVIGMPEPATNLWNGLINFFLAR